MLHHWTGVSDVAVEQLDVDVHVLQAASRPYSMNCVDGFSVKWKLALSLTGLNQLSAAFVNTLMEYPSGNNETPRQC